MRTVDPARHRQRRQQIVEAALACFAEKGFHATRTAEICRRVGMSPGHLFHYFDSKDAIIEEVIEQDRHEAARAYAALREREDHYTALLELLDLALDLATAPAYGALTLEIAAEATRNPRMARLFERDDAQIKADLGALLRDAANGRQIDATLDIESSAVWLLALLEGALFRAAVDPGFELERERASLHRLVERWLRPAGVR
ncbi:TetR/AcrR family transcriptional regulator [Lysobacter sp. CA199]|uniref:TetR/AcrR family transcriptional regulator n=1 Tax=Lysobacter sp. CA199 TaxID=3455608 RepID=UPI003F8D46DF